jgi:shikimate kinase
LNNLILCGFKRAGKTTYGKLIAQELHRPFIDTDELIPCAFSDPVFREFEKRAIFSIAHIRNSVIATGGGCILDPDNIALLKKMGKVIYLQVPKEILKHRMLQHPLPRFLDRNNLEESFEKMYAHRLPIYENIADYTWEVTDLEPSFA